MSWWAFVLLENESVIDVCEPGAECFQVLYGLLLVQLASDVLALHVGAAGQAQEVFRFFFVVDGEHWQTTSGP